MAKHSLKLLVLSTAFAVAPATAGNRIDASGWNRSGDSACPYERARLAAAAALAEKSRWQQASKRPTRVTLMAGVPRPDALGGVVRRSSLNP